MQLDCGSDCDAMSSDHGTLPAVTANRSVPGPRWSSHHSISLRTQRDLAASGEASSTRKRVRASAPVSEPHKSGLALKLLSSLKTRTERGRHHGFANDSTPR